MIKLTFLSFLFSLLAVSGLQAAAAEAKRLNGVIDAAIEVVYGECCAELSLEEKQARVRKALEGEYDLNVLIRRAIGRNWGLMRAEEQEQVLELIKQLLVKAYVKGMEGKERPEVLLGDVIVVTDKRIEIPSRIKIDGKNINVLYRLGKMSSGWQIYDIVAEDISVVSNYRQQIDDHFRKGDGQGLIDKLEELLSKEDINEEIQI
ncbi:MAG: MlaC/ttg2D family ABC transporter substrate-binding protein [Opitutales bacterium]